MLHIDVGKIDLHPKLPVIKKKCRSVLSSIFWIYWYQKNFHILSQLFNYKKNSLSTNSIVCHKYFVFILNHWFAHMCYFYHYVYWYVFSSFCSVPLCSIVPYCFKNDSYLLHGGCILDLSHIHVPFHRFEALKFLVSAIFAIGCSRVSSLENSKTLILRSPWFNPIVLQLRVRGLLDA